MANYFHGFGLKEKLQKGRKYLLFIDLIEKEVKEHSEFGEDRRDKR